MDNIRKHITYSKLEKVFNLVVEGLGDHDFELCKKVDINITSEVPMTCVGTMVANAPEYINEGYMVIDRKFGNYYSIPKTAVDCCTVDDMKIIIRALDEQAVLDVRNR